MAPRCSCLSASFPFGRSPPLRIDAMPLLIIVGIALGLGVFAILLTLGRPSPESVVLAEVTDEAYQAGSPTERQWLRGDYLAKPFVWFRGLFGHQPNSGIARR